jgi:hypothetical protein
MDCYNTSLNLFQLTTELLYLNESRLRIEFCPSLGSRANVNKELIYFEYLFNSLTLVGSPCRTWQETESNRFLHVLCRNDNYIFFTLKMH